MSARRIRGAWWVDFRDAGTRYRKRSPVNSKPGATEYEILLRLRLARGERITADPVGPASTDPNETFASFSARWFETYAVPVNKPSELKAKRRILAKHLVPAFGKHALSAIGAHAIATYKADARTLGLHPKTVNNHLAVLGKCLRTAEEWGCLPRAPRIKLLPAPPPELDFLAPEESARLLADRAEPLWSDMALVGVRAGLRLGELLALERRDIDIKRRMLTVARSYVNGILGTPKNNRARHIPMTAELCEVFARGTGSGLLFGRSDGRPQSAGNAKNAMNRICRRVGLRHIGWHVLRHTFASDLVAAGVRLPAVQQLLGHASITTTMRYAHLAPSALRGAIDALEDFSVNALEAEIWAQVGNTAAQVPPNAPERQLA